MFFRFLKNYYRIYNENLLKLLKRLGYPIPDWLEEDLKDENNADAEATNELHESTFR